MVDPDYETQSSYAFTVMATDGAGNSSEQAVSLAINDLIDTVPAAPSTPDLIAASDSGSSDTDDLTNDTTPTFTGTAEPGKTIEVLADERSLGTTTADSERNWEFTVPESIALPDGSYTIRARAIEGHTSQPEVIPLKERLSQRPPRNSGTELRNPYAFSALKNDGSVISWGLASAGGDQGPASSALQQGVVRIYGAGRPGYRQGNGAFAALKDDGSVITWGDPLMGGDSSDVKDGLSSGVIDIASSNGAFAALKKDGSVITWGDRYLGGSSGEIADLLETGVSRIYSGGSSFVALKSDGSLVHWGGGHSTEYLKDEVGGIVRDVVFAGSGFAVLTDKGSVKTFGDASYIEHSLSVKHLLDSGVSSISSNLYAFAALKEDGSVISWGDPEEAGSQGPHASRLTSDVERIYSTRYNFAALKSDRSVVIWGRDFKGNYSQELEDILAGDNLYVIPTSYGFASIMADGSINRLGNLPRTLTQKLSADVVDVSASDFGFAILQSDGSVISDSLTMSTATRIELQAGVEKIFSNGNALAALKKDGSLVTWGRAEYGGDSSSIQGDARSGIEFVSDPSHYDQWERKEEESILSSDLSSGVTITIDSVAPVFNSGASAQPIKENSGTGRIVYTASAVDPSDTTYTLKSDNNDDAASFSIDAASGDVTLNADPDYEYQSTYTFTVVATDAAGNSSEQDVTLAVTDLNDTATIEKQQIRAEQSLIGYRPGTSVSLPLLYSTSDNDSGLSGLTLNIHHDTERLTPIATNNGISDQLQADSVTATAITADTSDLDNSEPTDQMIQMSWASVNNSFPGTSLPAQVAVANFDTNSDAYDPLTGAPISTAVNFTASNTASNYGFEGTPVTLTPESFHLDIDGDGRTTALGDGLMVIRKLFGTAFAGDALTNKAASANAAVDTEAMHHWLEAGIASGNLDVDKDGRTTALGDGLMVIRHMFGSAFAGDALIDKAISNSSPYSGLTNAAELVSQNIQSLFPTSQEL